ncbi:MAG TPA: SCO6880 family protein [Baekduia sp.]|nr:SCO6880 family protein [Baekduia sp.]
MAGSTGEPVATMRFPSRRAARHLPRELRGVRLHEVPAAGPDEPAVGVVEDPRRGHLVAAARVEGGSFALAPAREQEYRIDRWGRLVAALAGSGGVVRRVGWVSRSIPSEVNLQLDYFQEASDRCAGPDLRDSYLELLERYAATADQREVLVWIAAARPERGLLDERLERLAGELLRLRGLLAGARIRVTEVLDRVELALAIRAGFDPFNRAARAEFVAQVRRELPEALSEMVEIAPGDVEERWREVACDGALHRVAWVKQWPTTDVGALFCMPLIVNPYVVRAVAWVAELVDPAAALRNVSREAIDARSDAQALARVGQRPTITRRQRWAGIDRRERELGAGHAEVHHAAYIATSVRGDDTRELDRAWQVTEHNAAAARMRLEVLTRRQAQALTLTLPLGRGLR